MLLLTYLFILAINKYTQQSQKGTTVDHPMTWFEVDDVVLHKYIVEKGIWYPAGCNHLHRAHVMW